MRATIAIYEHPDYSDSEGFRLKGRGMLCAAVGTLTLAVAGAIAASQCSFSDAGKLKAMRWCLMAADHHDHHEHDQDFHSHWHEAPERSAWQFFNMNRFKLVFFSPTKDTARILSALFTQFPNYVGKIGNYEQCAFVSRGTGQFKPVSSANPTIGSLERVEYVEEDRVEILVKDQGRGEEMKETIKALKQVHPYEEVAYDVYRLEDF
ncbi:hypothetical protein EYR38_007229 [Pleurotus pulmonarius]|nr:hypothetical protein EYR38_007229 [Pleurotus pulmonarius]